MRRDAIEAGEADGLAELHHPAVEIVDAVETQMIAFAESRPDGGRIEIDGRDFDHTFAEKAHRLGVNADFSGARLDMGVPQHALDVLFEDEQGQHEPESPKDGPPRGRIATVSLDRSRDGLLSQEIEEATAGSPRPSDLARLQGQIGLTFWTIRRDATCKRRRCGENDDNGNKRPHEVYPFPVGRDGHQSIVWRRRQMI